MIGIIILISEWTYYAHASPNIIIVIPCYSPIITTVI